jgi:hypothetical protein
MSGVEISFAQPESRPAAQGSGIFAFLLRLVASGFLSVGAVLVSAVGWGLLAYFTNSIYVFAAIVIGFIVAFAVTFPFKRVPLLLAFLLFFPTAALTILSVLLGDFLYYVLVGMKEFDWSMADAAAQVARNFMDIAGRDSLASLLFAAFGTLVGFFNAVRNDD